MEYRKLIKFGNNSFIISVPCSWLRKNNLVKGDVVSLEEDGDSRLILCSESKTKEDKEFMINTNDKDFPRVREELYKAYTDGFDVIRINGNNIDELSDEVRKIFNNFVAVEVIEQTHDKIVAKNLLNIDDVNIKDVIRRIDIILRSMLKDSVDCIENESCDFLVKRDLDINRLCFMLERVLKIALNDPNISRKINMRGVELLHSWHIVMNMESIGDEIKRIGRYLGNIEFNNKQKKEFLKIYSDIEKSYLDVMKSYYKKDKELAFNVGARKVELQNKCSLFFEKNNIPEVGGMVEKMKALVSWIRTIALFSYD